MLNLNLYAQHFLTSTSSKLKFQSLWESKSTPSITMVQRLQSPNENPLRGMVRDNKSNIIVQFWDPQVTPRRRYRQKTRYGKPSKLLVFFFLQFSQNAIFVKIRKKNFIHRQLQTILFSHFCSIKGNRLKVTDQK